jgi:nucleotide-binding universal stress UspA family protein
MAFRHFLVALDGSGSARAGLALALETARSIHPASPKLTFCYAVDRAALSQEASLTTKVDVEQLVAEDHRRGEVLLMEASAIATGLRIASFLLEGDPPTVIMEAASAVGADLIILGTHGRKNPNGALLGSVSERILRESPISVLTVRVEKQ